MLTKRLRSQIERHFYNYPADIALYNERVREIAAKRIITTMAILNAEFDKSVNTRAVRRRRAI